MDETIRKSDLKNLQQNLQVEIRATEARLGARIDDVEQRLSTKIDEVDERLDVKMDPGFKMVARQFVETEELADVLSAGRLPSTDVSVRVGDRIAPGSGPLSETRFTLVRVE